MNGLQGPIEMSRQCPESDALRLLISDENILDTPYNVLFKKDNWGERRSQAQLDGYAEIDGEQYFAQILIKFPGIYEQAMSRIRRREPRATVYVTVEDTPKFY